MDQTPEELIEHFERMASSYDNFPKEALYSPVTHQDMQSLFRILAVTFRAFLHK